MADEWSIKIVIKLHIIKVDQSSQDPYHSHQTIVIIWSHDCHHLIMIRDVWWSAVIYNREWNQRPPGEHRRPCQVGRTTKSPQSSINRSFHCRIKIVHFAWWNDRFLCYVFWICRLSRPLEIQNANHWLSYQLLMTVPFAGYMFTSTTSIRWITNQPKSQIKILFCFALAAVIVCDLKMRKFSAAASCSRRWCQPARLLCLVSTGQLWMGEVIFKLTSLSHLIV